MKVVLELQDQPSNVRRVTVRHDIVIGRGADCNLRLSAPQISRRHCFLRVGRDGVNVTDLDSSNGTFVDGERIQSGIRQPLVHGSKLSLGPISFLIQIRDDAVSHEVIKEAGSKRAEKAAAKSSEPSTVIASAPDVLRNARSMNLALEQAGASSDSREVTADFPSASVADSAQSDAETAWQRAEQLPQVDSRAEIVDLGRQLADAADLPNQEFQVPPPALLQSDESTFAAEVPESAVSDSGAHDADLLQDFSFFDADSSLKTLASPMIAEESPDVFDVAEVIDDLSEDMVEVVEDVEADVIEDVEVVEIADVANSAGVLSLDDDWLDPDDPVQTPTKSAMAPAPRLSGSAKRSSASEVGNRSGNGMSSVPPLVPDQSLEEIEVLDDEVLDDEVVEIIDSEDISEVEAIAEIDESVVEVVEVVDDFEIVDLDSPPDSELEVVEDDLEIVEVIDEVESFEVLEAVEISEAIVDVVEVAEVEDDSSAWFSSDAEDALVDDSLNPPGAADQKDKSADKDDDLDSSLRDFLKGF